MAELIQVFAGTLAGHSHSLTTSRIVARVFDKEHKNVLRDIRELECSEQFRRLNFEPTTYRDASKREQEEFLMTRDGFMFLAMGFTGAEAARRKEGFIGAFNDLETAALAGQREVKRLAALLGRELLRADPRRREIVRYRKLGLSMREICKLVGRSHNIVQPELNLLETCGLIPVPPERAKRRAIALANLPKREG